MFRDWKDRQRRTKSAETLHRIEAHPNELGGM